MNVWVRHRACCGRCVSGPFAPCETIIRPPPHASSPRRAHFYHQAPAFLPSMTKIAQNTKSQVGPHGLSPVRGARPPPQPSRPHGHNTPRRPENMPRGPKETPKTHQEGPEPPKDRAKTPKRASRRLQKPPRSPKRPPNGPPRRLPDSNIGPFPTENVHF